MFLNTASKRLGQGKKAGGTVLTHPWRRRVQRGISRPPVWCSRFTYRGSRMIW
jgi:hypothetical protein